jgi:hypothetical protein
MNGRLKVLLLVGVLAVGGVACGDPEDDAASPLPSVSPVATNADAGTGGTDSGTTGGSPGPVGSPDSSAQPTSTGEMTGGGGIYDETPSVAPAATND